MLKFFRNLILKELFSNDNKQSGNHANVVDGHSPDATPQECWKAHKALPSMLFVTLHNLSLLQFLKLVCVHYSKLI